MPIPAIERTARRRSARQTRLCSNCEDYNASRSDCSYCRGCCSYQTHRCNRCNAHADTCSRHYCARCHRPPSSLADVTSQPVCTCGYRPPNPSTRNRDARPPAPIPPVASEVPPAHNRRTNVFGTTFHIPNLGQLAHNPSRRLAATEIEVCGLRSGQRDPIERVVNAWGGAIVSDGSLPMGGFEINTAPAGGDLLLDQIKQICQALRARRAWVNQQAGLHVHIDCRDFSFYDIRRLMLVYAHIEKELFSIIAPSRFRNSFCTPCGSQFLVAAKRAVTHQSTKAAVETVCYGNWGNNTDAKNHKYGENRYAALNLHSWFFRGTIEARMHHGTTDYTKIANWLMLWQNIADWVIAHTDSEAELLLTRSPRAALLTLARDQRLKSYIGIRRTYFADHHTTNEEE